MKDYAWFKLLLMALGLMLTVFAVPSLIGFVTRAIGAVQNGGFGAYLWYFIVGLASEVFQLGIGIYLLMGGGAFVRYCLRRARECCAVCDYRLVEVIGDRCPECGTPFVRDDAATRVVAQGTEPRRDS